MTDRFILFTRACSGQQEGILLRLVRWEHLSPGTLTPPPLDSERGAMKTSGLRRYS